MGDGEGESKYTHFLNAPPPLSFFFPIFLIRSLSALFKLLFNNSIRANEAPRSETCCEINLPINICLWDILFDSTDREKRITVKIKIKGILEEVDK